MALVLAALLATSAFLGFYTVWCAWVSVGVLAAMYVVVCYAVGRTATRDHRWPVWWWFFLALVIGPLLTLLFRVSSGPLRPASAQSEEVEPMTAP